MNFSTECDTLPIFCKANANAVSSTQTNNTTKTTRFSRKSNEILMNISNNYHACLFGQHHKSSTIDLIFEYRHEIHIYAVDNHLNCHHRCLPFFVVIPTMIAEKAQPNANTINFKMSILYRSEWQRFSNGWRAFLVLTNDRRVLFSVGRYSLEFCWLFSWVRRLTESMRNCLAKREILDA